jgi:hypothetical protein
MTIITLCTILLQTLNAGQHHAVVQPSSSTLMGRFLSFASPYMEHQNNKLTEEQQRMYAAEKLDNFRWISKIAASYSSYTLTAADRAPVSLYHTLAGIGEHIVTC